MEGKAVQILDIVTNNASHFYSLNKEGLARILFNENVKDRKVAIYSIAGSMRNGKSFMLNFFLRYLHAQYVTEDISNWLGDPDSSLSGFSWNRRSEIDTRGIQIWSEIFLHGNDTAVILMDTQGVFDHQNSMKDNCVIFGISSLLSSVQIYNVKNNVYEDDLQHLQLFIEYGKLAVQDSGKVPFQNLLFLVRDWMNDDEHDFGMDGGNQFLYSKVLDISDAQEKELNRTKQCIKRFFEKIYCYLMPHPGLAMRNFDFSGKLSELETDFVDQLKDFVPRVLSPRNLVLKSVNGNLITAREYYAYFVKCVEFFNSKKTLDPEDLLTANARVGYMSVVHTAEENYKKRLSQLFLDDTIFTTDELDAFNSEYKQEALLKFNDAKIVGGEEFSKQYRKDLTDSLENFYEPIKEAAMKKLESALSQIESAKIIAKDNYKTHAKTEYKKISEMKKFDEIHENHKKLTMRDFNSELKISDEKFIEKYCAELEKEIDDISEELRKKTLERLEKDSKENKKLAIMYGASAIAGPAGLCVAGLAHLVGRKVIQPKVEEDD